MRLVAESVLHFHQNPTRILGWLCERFPADKDQRHHRQLLVNLLDFVFNCFKLFEIIVYIVDSIPAAARIKTVMGVQNRLVDRRQAFFRLVVELRLILETALFVFREYVAIHRCAPNSKRLSSYTNPK